MMGYPVSKEDLQREIKYQEGIYKIISNSNAQDTALRIKEHIEMLKGKAVEEEG